MLTLPGSEDSLLVRTDFGDDGAWESARFAALAENSDGFHAYVRVVDEEAWDGAPWEEVRRAAIACGEHAEVLFIVDHDALAGDHPIQVLDLSGKSRPPVQVHCPGTVGRRKQPQHREHGLGGVRRPHRHRRHLQGHRVTAPYAA